MQDTEDIRRHIKADFCDWKENWADSYKFSNSVYKEYWTV